jgi:hypothetical protein
MVRNTALPDFFLAAATYTRALRETGNLEIWKPNARSQVLQNPRSRDFRSVADEALVRHLHVELD